MIRAIDQAGAIVELEGWDEAETWARGARGAMDVSVRLPAAAEFTPDRIALLARALAPCGTMRVQGLRPADADAGGPFDAALKGRLRQLEAAAREAGLEPAGSEPDRIFEHEILYRYLGLPADPIGRTRVGDAELASLAFRRPATGPDTRPRLGIITQDLYYSFMYESPALATHFRVMKMQYDPFCHPDVYRPLIDFKPDILLVFRPDYLAPETFRAFDCPVIGFASEPLPRIENNTIIASDYNRQAYGLLQKVRGLCGRLYHYDPACIDFLHREKFPVAGLFPPCVCTDVYRPEPRIDPRWDAVFIGKSTPYREKFLFKLHLVCDFFHAAHGLEGAEETLPFLQRARIGLNIHRDETPNIEPRLLILMACGLFVLTQELRPNPWFREGEHYVSFRSEEDFVDKVKYFLAHDRERDEIARNGRRWACENANALVVLPRLIRQVLTHEAR